MTRTIPRMLACVVLGNGAQAPSVASIIETHPVRANMRRRRWAQLALCSLAAGCLGQPVDAPPGAEPIAGEAAGSASALESSTIESEIRAATADLATVPAGKCSGRDGLDPRCRPARIACGKPVAPAHGTVRAPVTHYGATARYACSTDYRMTGAATRTCQLDGTWSGSTPACAFVLAGDPCGTCGGFYSDDGTCSIADPANLGASCDVGSGKGACAQGGTVDCSGACRAGDPALGDPAVWHIFAAANGSWDWDCDGAITKTLQPAPVPPDCSSYGDAASCETSAALDYVTEDTACGQQTVLFTRACQWTTIGPTCLNTPANHRITYQQCR